jgi:hydrogenase large subunit
MHLFMLAGPDHSQAILRRTKPSLWERATRTESRWGDLHGYRTVGEIFHDVNPLTGKLYLEGPEMTRMAREG